MSRPLGPDDPARWMLDDEFTTTPTVYDSHCYICRDPEFAQMGLPLCKPCPSCTAMAEGVPSGHVPADDVECTVCGEDAYPERFGPAPDGTPSITDLPDLSEYQAPTTTAIGTLAEVQAKVREQIEADRRDDRPASMQHEDGWGPL